MNGQPSFAQQIRDYLFGLQYNKYDNIANMLNYLASVLDFSKAASIVQKGPRKGEIKPRKSIVSGSETKSPKTKSKRDYYNKYFGGGVR
jgi:hypothetical protein